MSSEDIKFIITVCGFFLTLGGVFFKQISDNTKVKLNVDGLKEWSRKIDDKINKNDVDEERSKNEFDRLKEDVNSLYEDKRAQETRIIQLEKMWERIDEKLTTMTNTIKDLVSATNQISKDIKK